MSTGHRIDFPAWSAWSSTTGFSRSVQAIMGGGRAISSSSINDYVEYPVALVAGTWDFNLTHSKGTNRGIYTVAVDGSTIGTIDGYRSLGGLANQLDTISGWSIAEDGVYPVRLTMASKNGGSSAYYGIMQWLSFVRTGA